MAKLIICLILVLTLISVSLGAPYNCNKLNCSSKNTNCKLYGCSPMFGCFETSKCPQGSVDACHHNTCQESTGNCIVENGTCDDGNPSTYDWCHTAWGCQFTLIEDPSTSAPPTCEELCNDNNPCTTDFCDFRGDCYHSETSCYDADACTNDQCGPNGCFFTAKDCNDNDDCTADFCSRQYGCYHEPIACSNTVSCHIDSNCDRNNSCETFSCNLTTNTCDYYAKDCGGNPCIDNQCTTGSITN